MEDACKTCNDLILNCFDFPRFILFILGTLVVPYFSYQKVADYFNLKRRRKKSNGKHLETIITGISSFTLLWFLGNYKSTFDLSTVLGTFIGLFLFTFVSEPAYANHTFANVSCWSSEMQDIVVLTVILVTGVMLYHINLAKNMSSDFAKIYIASLLFPMLLVYLSYKAVESDNEDKKSEKKNKSILHIHHVHIFYALAFFTRFSTTFSKIAAGMAIGASLHGAAAFGYDTAFENEVLV